MYRLPINLNDFISEAHIIMVKLTGMQDDKAIN